MTSRKVLVTIIFLILALLLIGFAYALWDKTLHIHGSTDTGIFQMGFSPTIIVSDNEFDKDVATTTVSLVDLDGDGIYDKIEVTIDNAYPSYEVWIDCFIRNYGTIPAKIQDIIVSAPSELYVEVNWFIYPGMQIDPEDEVMAEIYVHVEQMASQGSTYSFSGILDVVQWNEYTP